MVGVHSAVQYNANIQPGPGKSRLTIRGQPSRAKLGRTSLQYYQSYVQYWIDHHQGLETGVLYRLFA